MKGDSPGFPLPLAMQAQVFQGGLHREDAGYSSSGTYLGLGGSCAREADYSYQFHESRLRQAASPVSPSRYCAPAPVGYLPTSRSLGGRFELEGSPKANRSVSRCSGLSRMSSSLASQQAKNIGPFQFLPLCSALSSKPAMKASSRRLVCPSLYANSR